MGSSAAPLYFFASRVGRPTLDAADGGGNPFASAFIACLARNDLSLRTLAVDLAALTEDKSAGFQRPDIPDVAALVPWTIRPRPETERRVALVLVFSDYSSGGAASLPGAKHDAQRIAVSLEQAGFETRTAIDPERGRLAEVLAALAECSSSADAAVLYTTGHGAHVERASYLLPGDYPADGGRAALAERALAVTHLGAALRAKTVNLLLYGACRLDPFAGA